MKKYSQKLVAVFVSLVFLTSCNKNLELSPISSIADGNFWQTPDQVDAFVAGIHTRLRTQTLSLMYLGETRADIYGTEPGSGVAFSGESTAGNERMWLNTLDLDNPGVASYGGFYANINQINLLISKLGTIDFVTPANKNYYLGIAYGMRAYYYYHLTRAWGKVIIQTEPTTSFDISNLAKAASPEADVMALIKDDIEKSLSNFGADYSFKKTKSFWSKSATQMLKAEVFLWTSYRGGGANDATTAKNALLDVQSKAAGLSLVTNYASVFATNNRGNSEMIFAIRNGLNEATLPLAAFIPATSLIPNYYDSVSGRKFDAVTDNWGGSLKIPTLVSTYRKFNDKDSRKAASIQAAYTKTGTVYKLVGCFVNKFPGEQNAGVRALTNDYPIYRYADLLLLLAEAKAILGESPATEINLVRARAYGTNYSAATFGFPNQAGDNVAKDAILKERLLEFIAEGKRWLDLRRMGDSYVFANTNILPTDAFKLLWPVDRTTLTNNRLLEQTPGYPKF